MRRRALLLAGAVGVPPSPLVLAMPSVAAALTPRALAFPRDHGAHPDLRTEWWYVTGHARDALVVPQRAALHVGHRRVGKDQLPCGEG